MADHHAKEASNNAAIDKWKTPFTDLKKKARKTARDNTNTLITEYGSGIKFMKNYHSNKSKPWFYRKNLPREIVTMIDRGRSNHYSLAASLAKIHIMDSPRCECGYETEDLNHVLWQCNKYNSQRLKPIQKLSKQKLQLPLSVTVLFTKPKVSVCKALHSFFKQCNLRI